MAHPKPQRYTPKNPSKYVGDPTKIIARSSWERKFMVFCDYNVNVIEWGSESIPIPYWSSVDQRMRRYFIDFFVRVRTKDGKEKMYAIEVKPYSQTIPPQKGKKRAKTYLEECITYQRNQDKWKFAKEWSDKRGFEFKVMTEKELGIDRQRK